MNKRALSMPITLIIVLIIAAALLFIIFKGFLPKIVGGGDSIVSFSPAQDDLCLQKTRIDKGLGKTITDDDGDGRADSCDACVCDGESCNNDNPTFDEDGDKLPVKCDENDEKGKGAAVKEFGKNCIKDKTLFKIGTNWVCYPDSK